MEKRPIIAITIGDPAGIGPEVVIKAICRHTDIYEQCKPLLIGDSRLFNSNALLALDEGWKLEIILNHEDIRDATFMPGTICLFDMKNIDSVLEIVKSVGKISKACGKAAVEYVIKATELAVAGEVDAVATAPLNKEAMNIAGFHYIGHTEIISDITNSQNTTTMLVTDDLKVTHVTRHVPFRKIAENITFQNVVNTIHITNDGMKQMGYDSPRIAVAALNPHGGDNGCIGDEEITVIRPAVQHTQSEGVKSEGPIPADSVFFAAIRGKYDVVVCMYHDQGHIPVKTHGFEKSITITLGLPFIRTSADHGTAFDIAGKGIANESSMMEAIVLAAKLWKKTNL